MEPPGPSSKRRKSDSGEREAGESPPEATEVPNPQLAPTPSSSSPPSDEGGGDDYISGLPDAILGEIVALLSTRDAARVKTLASRQGGATSGAPPLSTSTAASSPTPTGPSSEPSPVSSLTTPAPASASASRRTSSSTAPSLWRPGCAPRRSTASRSLTSVWLPSASSTLRVATFSKLDLVMPRLKRFTSPGSRISHFKMSACPVTFSKAKKMLYPAILLANSFSCFANQIHSFRIFSTSSIHHVEKQHRTSTSCFHKWLESLASYLYMVLFWA
ncbi:hypothetical protein PVAP13_2NG142715 [Panicum virgatum]|uniref:F-box domain-containing protein n=1 Tax=Panicum virgatum TaxID=38727 RepID=A0A8T0VMP1_PANVG|nr:hypothetical protein PVAP13_2NG142715 [Panicum virgatum]